MRNTQPLLLTNKQKDKTNNNNKYISLISIKIYLCNLNYVLLEILVVIIFWGPDFMYAYNYFTLFKMIRIYSF